MHAYCKYYFEIFLLLFIVAGGKKCLEKLVYIGTFKSPYSWAEGFNELSFSSTTSAKGLKFSSSSFFFFGKFSNGNKK